MISTTRHMACNNPFKTISVVICSRDRVSQLTICLEYLAKAAARFDQEWELIIVDNGENTDIEYLLGCQPDHKRLPLKFIKEPIAGLARARNRALEHAKGAVIAFTDDDCHVDEYWLENIWAEFEQCSELALIGGRVDSDGSGSTEISIRPFGQDKAITSLSDIRKYLIGCNFAVRRSIVKHTGKFDICLGAGALGRSAEDIDYFYRVLFNKEKILFVASCRVVHAHGRSDAREKRKVSVNYIFGRGFWYAKELLKRDGQFLRYLYWELRGPGEIRMKLQLLRGFLCGLCAYSFRYRSQLIE